MGKIVMLKNRNIILATVCLTSTSALLTGCDSDSSSKSTPQAEITEQRVTSRIESSIENIANCEQSSSQAIRSVISSQALQDALTVSRSISQNATDGTQQELTIRPSADFGSCEGNPGSINVTSEHGNGDTRYELVFDSYCASGPEGDTVLTGTVITNEDGKPTDTGPLISGTELSTTDLQVQYEDDAGQYQTALVTIVDAKTDYGLPAIRGSDTPTLDNPDTTTIKNITIDIETTGEVHELADLSFDRHGGNSATVTIDKGTYTSPTGETVEISTAENTPLEVNVRDGEVTSGGIIVNGSSDSVATITAIPDSRAMEVSVNGEALSSDIDCANTDSTVKEVVGIILSQLPLY
jgi:hypothetical protein